MLLRYLSPLILSLLIFGCNTGSEGIKQEEIHRISCLGLFKPKLAEISFSENITVESENSQAITILKNEKAIIEYINQHLILKVQNKSIISNQFTFLTQNRNPFYSKYSITIPNKISREYLGGLEVKSGKDAILFIVEQKTNDFVLGVLSSESSDSEPEYLKALSVIIRTYILHNHSRHFSEGYDFCDNTHCMVFYGEQNKNNLFKAAVNSTRDEVLTYNGKLVDVYFSGSCGGTTKTPNNIWSNYITLYPYDSINCPYCSYSRYNNWSWQVSLKQLSLIFSPRKHIKKLTYTTKMLPESIFIETDNQTIKLSIDEFRLLVGRSFGWNKIYSDNFSFTINNDSVFVSGHGFGHCIGFCQSGAEEMSRNGKTYKEILKFYYPKADY